jgi:type II secretory pathway component PulK
MSRRVRDAGDEQGFALIAVLLVLAFVAVIGAEFAYSMRLEATAARVYKETLIATHLAEAGLEQAIRELATTYASSGWATSGTATPTSSAPSPSTRASGSPSSGCPIATCRSGPGSSATASATSRHGST